MVCKLSQMMILFDDTTIFNAGRLTNPLIKIDFVAVAKWFTTNKLTSYTDECEALVFGCGKLDNLSVLSTELGYENSCK